MIFLSAPLIVIFYMLGGQINKLFRPIGIPLSIIGVYLLSHNHPWYCVLPVLLYGFELTLGYGENSKLMKWLKDDELVRDVYSFICCIPVLACCFLTGNILAISGCLLIIWAYQIRMGSWGKIGKYDILPEDIFRGLAIWLSISWSLL